MSRSLMLGFCWLALVLIGCNGDDDTPTPDKEASPPQLDGKPGFPDTGPPTPDGPKQPDGPGLDGPDGPTPDGPVPDLFPPTDSVPWPLVVTCDATPQSGPPPLTVTFSATPSGGSAGYSFSWDFDDGNNDNKKDPQHTYTRIGKFNPVVTVTSGTENENCNPPALAATIDKQVTVPAGGGDAKVVFDAVTGQTLEITLTATNTSMIPYGYLETPDQTGAYIPHISTASGGTNQAQTTLTQTGTYTLAVFDSSNIGGTVQVRIEEL